MQRRTFLTGTLATLALPALARPATAAIRLADMRGSFGAEARDLRPDATDDQSRALQRAIDAAAAGGRALYIPAGRYTVSNLRLPSGTRLIGVPGQTRLVYRGGGHMIFAEGVENVGLDGLVLDGANLGLGEYAPALVHLVQARAVAITDCEVLGSAQSGIALDRSSGRVENTTVRGAAQAGIRSVEARGLRLSGNIVTDCANGGILVHRWKEGEDNTIVSGNRIERIAARDGGSGQNGNGINVFRAHGVIISDNHISDCALTAVRVNAGSNVQVTGNTALRSGETGLFVEFGTQGAVVSANLVDGAATGISVSNFDHDGRLAVVSGNIVRNLKTTIPYEDPNQGRGIGIAVEADTTVTGNVIENAPEFGMVLGWGPYLRNVTATGNVIRKAGVGIAVSVAEGARSTVIANNILSGVENGAVVGYRWNERATGDLARGPEDWPHLTVAGNRVS
ncbi:putative secreted repeat protein (TIGR03808 family) [Breoghania corrubedonensis]|uniref:Putative secreted repeat protein (TIGR03808 family) n=1 Tax=Breoghania corrubedonensis TaxID=665038 RepID=A0A2T5UW58_9HYPH|nr:TIGR03808 family TAT-translocated repetitive protein [Breoghania corrubedonensis]PTW55745.1 putative secreted repeat protein (TIGR03808 family) [Breoghania corrubedonensis]